MHFCVTIYFPSIWVYIMCFKLSAFLIMTFFLIRRKYEWQKITPAEGSPIPPARFMHTAVVINNVRLFLLFFYFYYYFIC